MSMLDPAPKLPDPPAEGRKLPYVAAIAEALALEMAADPDVFVYGLDVDDHKAIQGSTRGLLERFGPQRIFTTPLSEDAMTGLGVGAAMAGMRPVHVHIRMDFLMLAMNQLVNMAAKGRAMWGGQVSVPLTVRSIIGRSWGQGAQHSQGLHSYFMHIPGLKVVAPGNAYDAKGAMAAAIRDDNPVMMVEHRLLYPLEEVVPTERYFVPPGQARVLRQGGDITLVGISCMAVEAMQAADILAAQGVEATVIDPVWLAPMDTATMIESARRTGHLLVVDTAWLPCGAAGEILAQTAEATVEGAAVRMARMGYAPTPCPTNPVLEQAFYPNPETIAARALALLGHAAAPLDPASPGDIAKRTDFHGPF